MNHIARIIGDIGFAVLGIYFMRQSEKEKRWVSAVAWMLYVIMMFLLLVAETNDLP